VSAEIAFRRALSKYFEYSDRCWDCPGRGEICNSCPNQKRVLYWFERVAKLMSLVPKERAVEIAREVRGE